MKLVIASSNNDKINEIKKILGSDFELLSKSDFNLENFDVEEVGNTLEENSYIKAKAIFDLTHENVIADDTGLFVEALGDKPGVYTARYSGENATYEMNNAKLLKELSNFTKKEERKARFVTDICLITKDEKVYHVKGKLNGYIAFEKRGKNKFGYNPLFEVENTSKTLAELSESERLTLNHRRKALEELKKLLENIR